MCAVYVSPFQLLSWLSCWLYSPVSFRTPAADPVRASGRRKREMGTRTAPPNQTRKSERERERTGFALVTKGQAQGGSSLAGGQVDFKVFDVTLMYCKLNYKSFEMYPLKFLI